MMNTEENRSLGSLVETFLACNQCHGPVRLEASKIICGKEGCASLALSEGGVVLTENRVERSFFDDKHEIMHAGNEGEETKRLFYQRQAKYAESFFAPGKTVLDVGCGPAFSYEKKSGTLFIGLDYSLESIRANKSADLKVHGSAAALPLKEDSVDTIICFYSIHHMVGKKLAENRKIVESAFAEFGRVIRPGGDLVIFEVTPWWPFGIAEKVVWNAARQKLGKKLDMFFWPKTELIRLGEKHFPEAKFNRKRFDVSPFYPVYPAIALPKLKVPRFLYPFDVCAYHWHF
ncbi:MAG: class I SAM-dependent methyltransferase [Bdellovibrionota bacterium]